MSALDTLRQLPKVRRSWPHDDGSITVELVDDDSRVRAGLIHPNGVWEMADYGVDEKLPDLTPHDGIVRDRKSTRLNSSHA